MIETLQKHYKPDEQLLFAYWDKDFLQDMINDSDNYTLTKEDIEEIFDFDYNFGSVNDQIYDVIYEVLNNNNNKEDDTELWDTETEQDNGSNIVPTGTDN